MFDNFKKNTWARQRELKRLKETISITQMKEIVNSIINLQEASFVACSWLTGARVHELITNKKKGWIGIRPCDITLEEIDEKNIVKITIDNEKVRRTKKYILNGEIRYKSVNEDLWRKEIIINADGEDSYFINIINKHISNIEPTNPMFAFSYNKAWRIMNEYCKCNPHWIRNSRVTYWKNVQHLDDSYVQRMAGWSDGRMISKYNQISWKDIAKVI